MSDPLKTALSNLAPFTDFEDLVEHTFGNIRQLSVLKGGEYAGDYDRLANFRRNAAALDIPMEVIWSIYAAKHWDAVQQYVKDKLHNKDRLRAEPIEGRIDDLMLYLLLFKFMLKEGEKVEFVEETK